MAAPQQGNQSDNSAGIIWGVAAVFAALGAIWYLFKGHIVAFYLSIKLYEADFLSVFSAQKFEPIRATILSALADPSKVKFPELISIGSSVGDWLRFPLMIILFVLAIVVYLGNTARVYKRTYNMHDFAKLEQANWPQISPVVDLNLIKTDIDKGPWSMAMTPMQFCKKYHLLEEIQPERREGMSRKEWNRVNVVLKRGEANKIFALQLGQLWRGSAHLPPHIKALFAIFAARINADSQPAMKLLTQLSASAATGKLNLTGVNELLKKHENTKAVESITQSHAYVLTVMASMLEGAREDGVQASADFLWIKPIDRKLWYTLNTVGRQTPFVEVAGVFAHWIAEKQADRKIMVPMIEEATKALEIALAEVVYRKEEEV